MTLSGFNIIFPMSIVGIIADTVPSMPFGLQYRIKIFYSGFSILYKALHCGLFRVCEKPRSVLWRTAVLRVVSGNSVLYVEYRGYEIEVRLPALQPALILRNG